MYPTLVPFMFHFSNNLHKYNFIFFFCNFKENIDRLAFHPQLSVELLLWFYWGFCCCCLLVENEKLNKIMFT